MTDEFATLLDPDFFLLYGILHHYWLYGATVLQVNVIGRVFQPEVYFLY